MSDSSALRNRSSSSSALQWRRRSSAVKRHCWRPGTKRMTGFVEEYSAMAKYAGFDMAIMRDGK
jgi:hypothetical protein